MEDAAKRIHHCMSTVCKHLLCTTDMDFKTVASGFQSLLGLWAKYKKANFLVSIHVLLHFSLIYVRG